MFISSLQGPATGNWKSVNASLIAHYQLRLCVSSTLVSKECHTKFRRKLLFPALVFNSPPMSSSFTWLHEFYCDKHTRRHATAAKQSNIRQPLLSNGLENKRVPMAKEGTTMRKGVLWAVRAVPTQLGPLKITNLNHWTIGG
jgi:hypothetical protein